MMNTKTDIYLGSAGSKESMSPDQDERWGGRSPDEEKQQGWGAKAGP